MQTLIWAISGFLKTCDEQNQCPNVMLMFDRRRRRWASIKTTFSQSPKTILICDSNTENKYASC